MDQFYIPRKLILNKIETRAAEEEIFNTVDFAIVLAEPGAGKSTLLEQTARKHEVPCQRAASFIHGQQEAENSVVVIDALDEVKTSTEGLGKLLSKIRHLQPKKVMISSRSSAWSESDYRLARDMFEQTTLEPQTVRILPLTDDEQRSVFEHHFTEGDFADFRNKCAIAGLSDLISNPQFLILFAHGYIHDKNSFNSKKEIVSNAMTKLAAESNDNVAVRERATGEKILSCAGEIFAILLLSGTQGLSTREGLETDGYPFRGSITTFDNAVLEDALATKLFVPTTNLEHHEPVHRTVAEYLAARFLAEKQHRAQLSIRRCLEFIAPANVVREELRGLLGWMATLSDPETQLRVLAVDPYAIVNDGDISQLTRTAKLHLIDELVKQSSLDPYFRSSDLPQTIYVRIFF